MKTYNRRDLVKTFGGASLLLHPLLSSREVRGEVEVKKRFFCMLTGAGISQGVFWPNGDSSNYNFDGKTLEVLKDFKADLNIVRGLGIQFSANPSEGVDSHDGSATTILTGCYTNVGQRIANTSSYTNNNVTFGASIDQMIAGLSKGKTSTGSLVARGICKDERPSRYISFNEKGIVVPQLEDPRVIFNTIFGSMLDKCKASGQFSAADIANIRLRKKSVLDTLTSDIKNVSKRSGLGKDEQAKLDSYMTTIREIEMRLDAVDLGATGCARVTTLNSGLTRDFNAMSIKDVNTLVLDMIIAAFELDITRVATYVTEQGGTTFGPALSFLKDKDAPIDTDYHSLSHSFDQSSWDKLGIADRYRAEEFRRFIGRLKEIKEGDSNILQNSLALWTSEMGTGRSHNTMNIPIILAGNAGGTMKSGRYLDIPFDSKINTLGTESNYAVPENNRSQRILISILEAYGIKNRGIGYMNAVSGVLPLT